MILVRGARALRDRLSSVGLDIRSLHGRKRYRAGLRIAWQWDARTKLAYISTVDSFGVPIKFLIDDASDYVQSHLMRGHFYAEAELRTIRDFYRGGTFLDVGANIGNHALFAEHILNARVLAVEPEPRAYRLLRCNIALNDSRITHIPFGLSDHRGRASSTSPLGNLGATELKDDAQGSLELRTGDELLGEERIGFIKVDVEGMELAALAGLERTINRDRPSMIVEVNDQNIPNFQALLSKWGYEIRKTMNPYESNTYFVATPAEVTDFAGAL